MRLNHKLQPLFDYHKAKDLFWDPRANDLHRDRLDWEGLNELLPKVMALIVEVFQPYGDEIPFGLNLSEMLQYAATQLTRRLNAVARAVPQLA